MLTASSIFLEKGEKEKKPPSECSGARPLDPRQDAKAPRDGEAGEAREVGENGCRADWTNAPWTNAGSGRDLDGRSLEDEGLCGASLETGSSFILAWLPFEIFGLMGVPRS